jgi:NTE family protein
MIALRLSGGGFRATPFHLGALRRINELGVLSKIASFSSVSGGSILNGVLATRWNRLVESENGGGFRAFDTLIADPMRAFCKNDLRTSLLVWKPLPHCVEFLGNSSLTDLLAKEYARRLSLRVPLSEVTAAPDFMSCAADMDRFETAADVAWALKRALQGVD